MTSDARMARSASKHRAFAAALWAFSLVMGCGPAEPPESPILYPPDRVVRNADVQLAGEKPPNTRVLIFSDRNDDPVELTDVSEGTDWSGTFTLKEGKNEIAAIAQNAEGAISETSSRYVITLDTESPPSPALVDLPTYVVLAEDQASRDIEVGGSREAGAGILLDGDVVVELGAEGQDFTLTLRVVAGVNTFELIAYDRAGNRSTPLTVELEAGPDNTPIQRPAPPEPNVGDGVEDVPEGLAALPIVLRGTKAANTGLRINGDEVEPVGPETSWSESVLIEPGANLFVLQTFDDEQLVSDPVEVIIFGRVQLSPPSLSAPPENTNVATLVLAGTKNVSRVPVGVRVRFVDGSREDVVLSPNADASWTLDVALDEGDNDFSVLVFDEMDFESDAVGPFRVALDTTPPSAPTVSIPDTVLMPPGVSPYGYALEGAKDADAVVWVNGVEATQLLDAALWTASLPIVEGNNPVEIYAEDAAGNRSDTLSTTVQGAIGLPPPTVDNFPGDARWVRDAAFQLAGNRPAGQESAIFVRRLGEAEAVELVPFGTGTRWSSFIELQQGENAFFVSLRNREGERSAEVGPVRLLLDSIPPAPPVIEALPEFVTASSDDVSVYDDEGIERYYLTVRGQKDDAEVTTVRVSINGRPSESLIESTAPVDFERLLRHPGGRQTFCFLSADFAGNESEPVCFTVTLAGPPVIEFAWPMRGAVTNHADFFVSVDAIDDAFGIASVEICLDQACEPGELGEAGLFGAGLTIDAPENGRVYDVVVKATSESGEAGERTMQILYVDAPYPVSSAEGINGSQDVRAQRAPDGSLHVIWVEGTVDPDVYYASYDDSGDGSGFAWSDPLNLTPGIDFYSLPEDPDLAVRSVVNSVSGLIESIEIHVVWSDMGSLGLGAGLDRDIVHRVILNGQPSAPNLVTADDNEDLRPRILVDSAGRVHATWLSQLNFDSSYVDSARFENGAWSGANSVSLQICPVDESACVSAQTPLFAKSAEMVADSTGALWIAFQAEGSDPAIPSAHRGGPDDDIYLVSTLNGEVNFGPFLVTSDGPSVDSSALSIAIDDADRIHIVWADKNVSSRKEIFYARFDPGAIFSNPFSVPQRLPALAEGDESVPELDDSTMPSICVLSHPDGPESGQRLMVSWVGRESSAGIDYDVWQQRFDIGAVGLGVPLSAATTVPGADVSLANALAPACLAGPGGSAYLFWHEPNLEGLESVPGSSERNRRKDIFFFGYEP